MFPSTNGRTPISPSEALSIVSMCSRREPTNSPVTLFHVNTRSPSPYRERSVHSLKRVNRKGMSSPLTAITRRSSWPTSPSSRYFLNFFAFTSIEFRIRITYCLIGISWVTPSLDGGTESGFPACPSVSRTNSLDPNTPFRKSQKNGRATFTVPIFDPQSRSDNGYGQIHLEPTLMKIQTELLKDTSVCVFSEIAPKIFAVGFRQSALLVFRI